MDPQIDIPSIFKTLKAYLSDYIFTRFLTLFAMASILLKDLG